MGKDTKKKTKKLTDQILDKLWGQIIHKRKGCEYCGRTEGVMNAHHIFTRSNKSTRWDTENGILLCVHHHVWDNFSAHKNPMEFHEWLQERMGMTKYKALREKSKKSIQCDQLYRQKMKILLEDELNNLTT